MARNETLYRRIEDWFRLILGVGVDTDGVALRQCVDVAQDFAEWMTGLSWQSSLGWGNAKDIFAGAPGSIWHKIRDAVGILPQRGDIIVFGPWAGNPYGHIAVVAKCDMMTFTVMEQDGFFNETTVCTLKTYRWADYPIIGWLRLKALDDGAAVPAPAPSPQVPYVIRKVLPGGANIRTYPDTADDNPILRTLPEGFEAKLTETYPGEVIDGDEVWVHVYGTAGCVARARLAPPKTLGLPRGVTPRRPAPAAPAPAPAAPGARLVTTVTAINYRRVPSPAGQLIDTFDAGADVNIDGVIHGDIVAGSDVWARGALTGGFMHISGFAEGALDGLKDLGRWESPTPTPAPTPVTPAPTPTPVAKLVTASGDCPAWAERGTCEDNNFLTGLTAPGSSTAFRRRGIMIHNPGDNLTGDESLKRTQDEFNTLMTPGKGKSANMVVSPARAILMVGLGDTAYHVRSNDVPYRLAAEYFGIEFTSDCTTARITEVCSLVKVWMEAQGCQVDDVSWHRAHNATACPAPLTDAQLAQIRTDVLTPTPTPTPDTGHVVHLDGIPDDVRPALVAALAAQAQLMQVITTRKAS